MSDSESRSRWITLGELIALARAKPGQHVLERAGQPKRLWIVNAANHRFSDNLAEFDRTLLEAITWIGEAHAEVAK